MLIIFSLFLNLFGGTAQAEVRNGVFNRVCYQNNRSVRGILNNLGTGVCAGKLYVGYALFTGLHTDRKLYKDGNLISAKRQLFPVGPTACIDDTGTLRGTVCSVAQWPDPKAPTFKDLTTGSPLAWRDVPSTWSTIAEHFNSVLFNEFRNKLTGRSALLQFQNPNVPSDEISYGVEGYFGDIKDRQPEAIPYLGALVGGTIGGRDYSQKVLPPNPQSVNLIRLAKKYYSENDGVKLFANNSYIPAYSEFWYLLMPPILGCQLAHLYGSKAESGAATGERSLNESCLNSVNTINQISTTLESHFSGRDIYQFSGVTLRTDTPIANTTELPSYLFQPYAYCPENALRAPWLNPIDPPPKETFLQLCEKDQSQGAIWIRGLNTTQYQTDAAAGAAYLNFFWYKMSSDQNYLERAERALNYIENTIYNPNYEILLGYGALTSARLSAEGIGKYKDSHRTEQLLNWIFSESDVRYVWSMHSGSWGDRPVYGLLGSPRYTVKYDSRCSPSGCRPVNIQEPELGEGNAGPMNTMMTAAILAPIARYHPEFAQALGKYLTHVATNALQFYPRFIEGMDPATLDFITNVGSANQNGQGIDFRAHLIDAIPFEALHSKSPEGHSNIGTYAPIDAYGTGPAAQQVYNPFDQDKPYPGWGYKTNLAVYGGTYAPVLAKIFNKTNVDGIMQMDLVVSDLPKPIAYPTYLIYNPFGKTKEVLFDITQARTSLQSNHVMIYDPVEKVLLESSYKGSPQYRLQLKPQQARVLVVVPDSERLNIEGRHLVARPSTKIVDYYAQ